MISQMYLLDKEDVPSSSVMMDIVSVIPIIKQVMNISNKLLLLGL